MNRSPVHSVVRNDLGSPSSPDSSQRGNGRDFYFSHIWEEDEIGRNNHKCARRLRVPTAAHPIPDTACELRYEDTAYSRADRPMIVLYSGCGAATTACNTICTWQRG
jgi:hypothetical protein